MDSNIKKNRRNFQKIKKIRVKTLNCLSKTKAFENGRLKDLSSSASKHLFLLEKNLLLPRLTGWQYCILKTNLSNHCCKRCNCADFTFFMIFFNRENFAKIPSTWVYFFAVKIRTNVRNCSKNFEHLKIFSARFMNE